MCGIYLQFCMYGNSPLAVQNVLIQSTLLLLVFFFLFLFFVFSLVANLKEHFETAKTKAEQRRTQLDSMLVECRQFHNDFADFEQWLASIESDLDARPVRPESVQINSLIKQHEVSVSFLFDKP